MTKQVVKEALPKTIWAWEEKDNDPHNGTGYHDNGWHEEECPPSWTTRYIRADLAIDPTEWIEKLEKRLIPEFTSMALPIEAQILNAAIQAIITELKEMTNGQ